mmetsp:Transcript_33572/g.81178  ORF Transcript_33572/g.81178 Transcript_33572/m.81178 type:complete len:114 (-) Transcript_33572:811-1152(-)
MLLRRGDHILSCNASQHVFLSIASLAAHQALHYPYYSRTLNIDKTRRLPNPKDVHISSNGPAISLPQNNLFNHLFLTLLPFFFESALARSASTNAASSLSSSSSSRGGTNLQQ